MSTHNLREALEWRYATNLFDTTKEVSENDLTYILESTNLMPTSFGLQPFRIIVIRDSATKEKLVEHSWDQRHVADNSHLVVLAARTDTDESMISEYTARIEATRGLPTGATDGFKNMMIGSLTKRSAEDRLVWAQKQTYIALGGMIAAASERGIDNHALEGFDPQKYNEILGLTEKNLHATVILALGYRSAEDAGQHYKKVRLNIETLIKKV